MQAAQANYYNVIVHSSRMIFGSLAKKNYPRHDVARFFLISNSKYRKLPVITKNPRMRIVKLRASEYMKKNTCSDTRRGFIVTDNLRELQFEI